MRACCAQRQVAMRDFPHDVAQDKQSRAVLSERIGKKITDYERYKFTGQQSCALNIFFDLAQEYVDLRYLYHLPVEVLRLFFSVRAELYVRGDDDTFTLRTVKDALVPPALPAVEAFSSGPVHSGAWWLETNQNGVNGSVYEDQVTTLLPGVTYNSSAWVRSPSGAPMSSATGFTDQGWLSSRTLGAGALAVVRGYGWDVPTGRLLSLSALLNRPGMVGGS